MSARRSLQSIRTRKSLRSCSSLSYEALEPKRLLATFVVNSVADEDSGSFNGQLTLREAVVAARTNTAFGDAVAGDATGDRILFSAGIAGQSIVLTNGELLISDDLVIQGGSNSITVSGGSLSRVFAVNTTEVVRFMNFTISDGNADKGGGISAAGQGRLALTGMTLENNRATGSGGGAIHNLDSDLFISNSAFRNNRATGVSGSGGAYLTESGDSALSGVTMQSNSSNRAGGAIEIVLGRMFVTGSLLGGAGALGNVAGPVGTANPGNGGALHVSGTSGAEVYISSTTVAGNHAAREGGGLWNQSGSTIDLRGSTHIDGNVAGGNAASQGGGGIFNNGGAIHLQSSLVSNNQAIGSSGSGGGLFSTAGTVFINQATMTGNSASRAGGAIEAIDGLLFIRDSMLGGSGVGAGNTAGPTGSAAPGNGGAIHISGGNSTAVIEGTDVRGNLAAKEGGGLWNQAGSLMVIRAGSTIADNSASGNSAGGGGIFNNGGQLVLQSLTVSGNRATGSGSMGGGLLQVAGGYVLDNGSTFPGNSAVFGGGAIAVTAGYLGLTGSTIEDNQAGDLQNLATSVGGGLLIDGTAAAVLAGTRVAGNSSATSGGGAFLGVDAYLRTEAASNFDSNRTRATVSSGGGVFSAGTLRLIDSVFSSNAAGQSGGGVHISATGSAALTNTSLTSNNGGANGGGIFNGNLLMATDCSISTNLASNAGGGIYTEIGAITSLDNTTLTGNLPDNQN